MGIEKYGHFSDDGKEFIVTRPDTPAPWVNYISNTKYTGLVTNTGGGYSYYICPKDSRITRFRYNGLPWDRPGRYVYLRDASNGEYWSLSWQPVAKEPSSYECHHGMGYTEILQEYNGIKSKILYFVPLEDDLEIWHISLENNSQIMRDFSIFAYVELCLGHALVDLINQPNDKHFNIVKFDRDNDILLATKNYWVTYSGPTVAQPNQAWDKYVFFASTLPVSAFDGSKDAFIGRWRSESNPIAVENCRCENSAITCGDACAALQSDITIPPGEHIEFCILMGVVDRDEYESQSLKLVGKYRSIDNVHRSFDTLNAYWDNYLSSTHIDTPDPVMNLMINTWAKRQSWVTFNMHRTAGYYHGGLLFGTGIRDQCQDLMGPLLSEPSVVADRICEMLSHQFADGSSLHNYFRLSGYGEKTGHSDTPLWLPFAIISYLKETANFGFLNRIVPFQDEGEETVLEHFRLAIDYPLANLTPNNLPKFGPGDWNDTLDYVGRKGIGESVWVAEFLCFILKEACDLMNKIGDTSKARQYNDMYEVIKEALNQRCWDGEWYIRGTRDDGGVIGSRNNDEGKIFMNAQSWAVISGIAPNERAHLAMDSAYKMLNTSRGPKILTPAYTKVDPGIGLATRCVPGKKENGAIFNHVVSWAILAECILGNGNRAYEYFHKTMPINQANDPDLYKMEPYVYSEYVTSPDHPTFGKASHSWLTGSAVWMFRDAIDYMLGVRPTYDGLIISPSIPSQWDGYSVLRKFRGAVYRIDVENPNHCEHGISTIEVDGQAIIGDLVPIFTDGTHHVKVVMG